MSFKYMAWASEQKTGSSTKKLILLLLADRANDTGVCFPSQQRLADDCELSRRAIIKNIKDLETMGFLTIHHRSKDGVKLPNNYVLHKGGVVNEVHKGSERGAHKPINEPISDIGHPTEKQIIEAGKKLNIEKAVCTQFYLYYESRKWRGILDFIPLLRKWNMNEKPKDAKNEQLGGVTW